jgi:hypothetical protein
MKQCYEDEWKLVFKMKHNSLHAIQIMNNDTRILFLIVRLKKIKGLYLEAKFYYVPDSITMKGDFFFVDALV